MTSPIQVDVREGSGQLVAPLRARGIPVQPCMLPYGDVAFLGNGPEGCPTSVGVEYKKIMDVLKCVTDGRFAAVQLPGLLASYQVTWLLIEGHFRADRNTGRLQRRNLKGAWVDASVGARGFMYRDLQHWLHTMTHKAGVRIAYSYDEQESCNWLHGLWSWWTAKGWEGHRSLDVLHDSNAFDVGRVSIVRPSTLRRVAACLPGVGTDRSASVADHFTCIADIVLASQAEWEEIPGIGKVTAERIYRAIHGAGGNGK